MIGFYLIDIACPCSDIMHEAWMRSRKMQDPDFSWREYIASKHAHKCTFDAEYFRMRRKYKHIIHHLW